MVFFSVYLIIHSTFPLFISMLLSQKTKSSIPQIILLASSFLYMVWFVWVVYDLFTHPDGVGFAVAFVCVGMYSLPIMLPLWFISGYYDKWFKKNSRI
jgi:hypothetical protein